MFSCKSESIISILFNFEITFINLCIASLISEKKILMLKNLQNQSAKQLILNKIHMLKEVTVKNKYCNQFINKTTNNGDISMTCDEKYTNFISVKSISAISITFELFKFYGKQVSKL